MKLNKRQKRFLKMIGRGYLVRDKDNNLIWFENEPINFYNIKWLIDEGSYIVIHDEEIPIFPDLSFIKKVSEENNKPYSIEELLK